MTKRKILPISILFSLILLVFEASIYQISIPIAKYIGIIEYVPKISAIDDRIPIVSAFIVIYILAFLFWIICPIINSMASKERYSDYIVGFMLAYFIGFIMMCLFPTVMDRTAEGITQDFGTNAISRFLLWFVYTFDYGDTAHCLLPSYHSLASVYCYLGVMGCREIPKGLRIFICIFAILIVLSTLFVKQHYFLDAVTGSAIAVIIYALSRKFHFGKCIMPLLKERENDK